jgi:hypothetical protein
MDVFKNPVLMFGLTLVIAIWTVALYRLGSW